MSLLTSWIREVARKMGYQIHRIDPSQIIPENIPDPELYRRPELFVRLFRPWTSSSYDRHFTPEVMNNTMLGRHKLYYLYHFVNQTLRLDGDIFEAGVGSGGSAKLMLDSCLQAKVKKRMWLLDTFAGYQKVDRLNDGAHVQINQCACKDRDYVMALLKNEFVEINAIEGLIPATLDLVKTDRICFAHIDVNLHEPTKAAAEFCLSRMPPGGVILFDDYSWPATYGARKAIDEVVQRFGQQVICLAESTQAFLVKR